jgi:hypothetical protein
MTESANTEDEPARGPGRRGRLIGALVVAVLAVGGLLAVSLSRRDSSGPNAGSRNPSASEVLVEAETSDSVPPASDVTSLIAAGATTSVADGATSSIAAGGPTETMKPIEVGLDEPADLGGGVLVAVVDIESVEGEGQGIGERSGPALRVTVELTNGTGAELLTELALVNLYYGPDLTPSTPLSGPGVEMFPARAEDGATVSGRFVFSVPEDQRDLVIVEFTFSTDAPMAIFAGAVQ